ncbi:DUF2867 domain-containing protein [Oceanospirillum sediminis]|uniref:DUF2867 domain-containing protein n=1 Tax=Oceanospirillum sediminis TaxID=2760088 RepID=A0A839IUP5_9GAMM|nr:DUF2867 domain-containing protein [Oceanospirillum sediminis]MBB1488671.1 DUF2867 domain-containing protein [Oceanospirillum sediminis]
MWQVKDIPVPESHYLTEKRQKRYFHDALTVPLQKSELRPDQIQIAIFSHMPDWVNNMMAIRNRLVRSLGFNTEGNLMEQTPPERLQEGDQVGFLSIIHQSEQDIISYSEDKHMQFYLGVSKTDTSAIVSTLVNPKTRTGWLYLQFIRPFHWLIARAVLHNAVKKKRI